MDTSLQRIRAKITELEAKLADLHIVERELLDLELTVAPKTIAAPAPTPSPKRQPKAKGSAPTRQTIGGAIAEVLGQHGALPVAEIAEHITASGREIDKRSVSFSLQAMKKQGLVKSGDGKWMLQKARSKPASA